ncbi:MAG: phenylalanine--tRNA ligase subunit beta [Bacteroidia bacterium]|jgi:phenylalanyl-tRNA synthetase beta chain|nr:phenylalanine--tRNA ligase subunit beta [Bacteroidia bacterium]
MKIAYNWLREYLPEADTQRTAQELSQLLTGCGLEVESVEPFETIPGGLRGLVVGEVITCVKHPNADKLSLTTVNTGGDQLLSIVCGAPNVAAGQKVIVATVGTTVHPVSGEPFEIKKSKIRGELSEGMICAEDEIGLGQSHAGIMVLDAAAVPGTEAAVYFGVQAEEVFEIGLTPNRADAASHYGVARDLNAVFLAQKLRLDPTSETGTLRFPQVFSFTDDLPASPVTVEVHNHEACARYAGIHLTGITVKDSPEWLQQRLRSIGLRPINNVVDITNYVLHELGQPLHAFDSARISGSRIVVRKATAGETFVTLDGAERKLHENDLMICDENAPMCIAGVFGGLHSGVSESTTSIFLESAYFDAVHVRKTAKRLGLKTDSSFRFERGTDPDMVIRALERAVWLLQEIAGAEVTTAPVDIYPQPVEPVEIAFTYNRCDTLIGKTIERNTIKRIIEALGMEIESTGNDTLLLAVPPFKVDVTREADVVEEVLRVYGYNNIDFPEQVKSSLSWSKHPDGEILRERISEMLAGTGFAEILNNSLTRAAYTDSIEGMAAGNVTLLNPLSSDLGILRRTLLFGGLETITYNQNRKAADLRLFEFGSVYSRIAQSAEPGRLPYHEEFQLGLWLTGRRHAESWNHTGDNVTFTDLKAAVEQILNRTGVQNLKTEAIQNDPLLAEGIVMLSRKTEVVRYGRVRTAHLKSTQTSGEVFFAAFNWDALLQAIAKTPAIRYTEVPKFPAVRRDLALVINKQVNYRDLEQLALQTEKQLLRSVNLFDVYEGEKLGSDKKSYALSFILQDENATLTDKQIEKVMEKLAKAFTEKLGAVIRS